MMRIREDWINDPEGALTITVVGQDIETRSVQEKMTSIHE